MIGHLKALGGDEELERVKSLLVWIPLAGVCLSFLLRCEEMKSF
jgi:hypothetical protein